MADSTALVGPDPSLVAKAESQAPNTILPPGRTPTEILVKFVKDRAYQSSRLYAEDYSRFRKSELYDESEQWIRRAKGTSDAAFAQQWKEIEFQSDDPTAVPLPVFNEGVLLRENESARLGRPEYKPKVRAKSQNPGTREREGAKGAERALQSRLKDMWGSQEDLFFLHPPLYGGVWLESRWDQTWLDTIRVPVPSLCCPRHPKSGIPLEQTGPGPLAGMKLPGMDMEGEEPEEPEEPGEEGEPLEETDDMGTPLAAGPPQPCSFTCRKPETTSELGTMPESVMGEGQTCPMCADHPQLVNFQPTMQEALDNPELGKEVPKGDWFMSVRSPYQIFPRDAGIGVDPTDVDEWAYVHLETLDWAEERFPDKIRDLSTGDLRVHPENPATLMAGNPTVGNPSLLRNAATLGIFKSSVIVYEYNRKPWLEWNIETKRYEKNRGRHVIVIDNVVCLDDYLLVESQNKRGTFLPRVKLQFIPWEFMDGGRRATVGQSLWDRVFDAQDTLNERISQIRAVNQRGALPWYLKKRGVNFETRSAGVAVPFRHVEADLDPTDSQPPLQLIGNTTIDAGVYQELNFTMDFINKQVVEVERGQVPPGVAAATAIAYLKTESGEKRRPRIKRLRDGLVRAWDHGVQLMAAFYIEDRPYTYEDETGEERSSFIHGNIIAEANPRVDIYPTPDYDVTDARRENIRDMIKLGVLQPNQSPQLNRKIVKAMDEGSEFFVDDDLQEQQAQREWMYFQEDGKVPVIDPSLDDHLTHYQDHGRRCFSEWFRENEDQANWDQVLSILGSDWDETLKQIALASTLPAQVPPTLPGMPPMPAPPQPSLQDQILAHWSQRLASVQMPVQQGSPLWIVLVWRAHTEAHKLTVEVQQMKAQPQVQAPGQGSNPTTPEEAQAGAAAVPAAPPPPVPTPGA